LLIYAEDDKSLDQNQDHGDFEGEFDIIDEFYDF